MVNKLTAKDIDVSGKRVLTRVDFNVPMHPQTGVISDDTRLRAVLPTIEYLRGRGAKVILCSHLGRPKGQVVESLRLGPVAQRLSQLLGLPVAYSQDCVGPQAEAALARLGPGEVLLLENLRFHPGEEGNDPDFARALASLADVFVNDAFGVAHRAHASTVGVTKFLPSVAGFLLEKEIEIMGRALNDPVRPFAALIGGAKVGGKIAVIENLLSRVDTLLIGGGMAGTFFLATGLEVGQSLVERERLDFAQSLLETAREGSVCLLLPEDVVVVEELEVSAEAKIVPSTEIPANCQIVDIGPQTIARFSEELRRCHTIVWNGPMGVFEFPPFAQGTVALAHLLAELEATVIVGGGSTAEAVEEMGLVDQMTHVSTGGGAALQFLGGEPLVAVEALLDRKQ